MKDVQQKWRINLYRLVRAMGSPDMLGDPVEMVWITPLAVFSCDPAKHKGMSGSRRRGETFYDTEKDAWIALLAAFETWTTKKRAAVNRMLEVA